MNTAIKALGDWTLDVLGVPFGSRTNKDRHDEFFSTKTELYLDKINPLVLYYHGFTPEGKPQGDPQVIGKVEAHSVKNDGVWFRVVLDKTNEYAQRVWQAAKNGMARASTGSIAHLVRIAADGEILNWAVSELSIFDAEGDRQPANPYAVALPAAKSLYALAGLSLPAEFEEAPEGNAIGEERRVAGDKPNKNLFGENLMPDEIKIEELVTKAVATALDAAEQKRVAAAKAQADFDAKVQAEVDVKMKAEREAAAKANRLPDGEDNKAPYQAKFGELKKYDNLDAGDTAMLIDVLQAGKKNGGNGANPNALKALALKLEGEKGDVYQAAKSAFKSQFGNVKANELNYSTQASYGDEWVGVAYSTRLWEAVRQESFVVNKLMERAVEVPPGFESIVLPLEAGDLTFYKVAQATGNTSGRPDVTVTASKLGTNSKTLSLAKMGARAIWSGEMEEDSLIPFMAQLRRQIEIGAAEQMEHAVIDGDTATGATTNINDIGGTPAGTEVFLLVNGFRKSPLVTTTANSRSGTTLGADDFLETVKLMGLAGQNAVNKQAVEFILDLHTAWKALALAEVASRDVFANPTIESGELTSIYGYKVRKSAFMHYANQDATYGLKANSAGKLDLDTASNNTTGSILAVRYDQWQLGMRRRLTIETQRIPEADASQIVAIARWGLTQRDTEASAITYNITL